MKEALGYSSRKRYINFSGSKFNSSFTAADSLSRRNLLRPEAASTSLPFPPGRPMSKMFLKEFSSLQVKAANWVYLNDSTQGDPFVVSVLQPSSRVEQGVWDTEVPIGVQLEILTTQLSLNRPNICYTCQPILLCFKELVVK